MSETTASAQPEQPAADNGQKRSLTVPIVAVGLLAAAAVAGYLLARYVRAPQSPAEQAHGLVRSCERLIREINSSLAELRQTVSAVGTSE